MPRASFTAVVAAALLAAGGCGGGGPAPIRIGLLIDCTGVIAATHDSALAAAELPLLQHGGTLVGRGPNSGVAGASVAGRPVQIVQGCTETGVFSRMIAETERLIDTDHVSVVIGATGWSDGIVFRDLARRYPTIPFVVAASWAQEVTLHDPAPNLYRFVPDVEQAQAGLATYAYRTLGWRRAATVAEDEPMGWGSSAAFTAEFCALGGTIDRVWTPAFGPGSPALTDLPRSIDGVIVMEDYGYVAPVAFLRAYTSRHPHASRSLLLSMWVYGPADFPAMAGVWPRLHGVVASISGVPDPESAVVTAYRAAYRRAFPGLPLSVASNPDVEPFRDAMQAVLEAIATAHGNLGDHRARLRAALARTHLQTTAGPVRLGQDRQAVVANSLVQIDGGSAAGPLFHRVRTIPGVDETVGGLFGRNDAPTLTRPVCVRHPSPPWS